MSVNFVLSLAWKTVEQVSVTAVDDVVLKRLVLVKSDNLPLFMLKRECKPVFLDERFLPSVSDMIPNKFLLSL